MLAAEKGVAYVGAKKMSERAEQKSYRKMS